MKKRPLIKSSIDGFIDEYYNRIIKRDVGYAVNVLIWTKRLPEQTEYEFIQEGKKLKIALWEPVEHQGSLEKKNYRVEEPGDIISQANIDSKAFDLT